MAGERTVHSMKLTALHGLDMLTAFLKPRKAPKKVSGREMPNQRQRRASRVVNGTAALDPAPHRNKFKTKKTVKVALRWRRWREYEIHCD